MIFNEVALFSNLYRGVRTFYEDPRTLERIMAKIKIKHSWAYMTNAYKNLYPRHCVKILNFVNKKPKVEFCYIRAI